MLPLIRQIENISACRDRDILAALVVAGVRESFPARSVTLLRLPSAQAVAGELIARADLNGLTLADASADEPQEICEVPSVLLDAMGRPGTCCVTGDAGQRCCLLLDSGAGAPPNLLLVDLNSPLDAEGCETLERFARFFLNYTRLLDDSEQDTLTQLLNRKTFDDSFDRLLAEDKSEPPPPECAERRTPNAEVEEKRQWLAVADIDFFKRVNDTFGHLFGDEVLIRFAGLMRKSFRKTDRLFRFGGEEFVILLKPSTETNITRLLDRFRSNVENFEFPRVGQVTCSLGFAPIDPKMAPTDILGAADAALYYSKSHGRNQVNSYHDLVSRGLIFPPKSIEPQQPDDIDALFG